MKNHFFKICCLIFLLQFSFACQNKQAESTSESVESEETAAQAPAELKNVVFEKLDAVGFKMKMMQIGTSKKTEQRKINVLDVRTAIDFGKARIENAVNIDFNAADFKATAEKQLDKQVPVFVYAENTEKAEKASATLKELNFRAIFYLDGGFPAWLKENSGEVQFSM